MCIRDRGEAVHQDNAVLGFGQGRADKFSRPLHGKEHGKFFLQHAQGEIHRLGKALVRVPRLVPQGVVGRDDARDLVAAASVVVLVQGLDKALVEALCIPLAQKGHAHLAPQQAEGRVGHAVLAHRAALLVMVKTA